MIKVHRRGTAIYQMAFAIIKCYRADGKNPLNIYIFRYLHLCRELQVADAFGQSSSLMQQRPRRADDAQP